MEIDFLRSAFERTFPCLNSCDVMQQKAFKFVAFQEQNASASLRSSKLLANVRALTLKTISSFSDKISAPTIRKLLSSSECGKRIDSPCLNQSDALASKFYDFC